jgi:hypothetical protein
MSIDLNRLDQCGLAAKHSSAAEDLRRISADRR